MNTISDYEVRVMIALGHVYKYDIFSLEIQIQIHSTLQRAGITYTRQATKGELFCFVYSINLSYWTI